MNILIYGASIRKNFGGPSLLLSTVTVLGRVMPDVKFTFISPEPADSVIDSKEYGLERIIVHPRVYKKNPSDLLRNIFLTVEEFRKADAIIDLWGIMFYGQLYNSFFATLPLLIGKCLGKPVVKYTSDMGPFKSKFNRYFVRMVLNRIDLILARSNRTKYLLSELEVSTPIHVCPDTAFVLKPLRTKKEKVIPLEKIHKKLVGVSVSHIIQRSEQAKGIYINSMSKIIDYLTKKDVYVIIIPNEIYGNRWDDLSVAREIFELTEDRDNVLVLEREYPARELKGIIGLCDLLIGARYHSIVAALSLGIPVVAISWHHKYDEIMRMAGLEDFVFNIQSLNCNDLSKRITELLENKEIHEHILTRTKYLKKEVFKGGEKCKVSILSHLEPN